MFMSIGFTSCNCNNWTDLTPDEFEKSYIADGTVTIDVRTADEFAQGHLYHAVNIDWQKDGFMDEIKENFNTTLTLAIYCRSGKRSAAAAQALSDAGYKVLNLTGGYTAWTEAGKMTNSTINGILQNLNQEARGVEVILHDTKNEIRRLLERAPVLESFFNCRVDIIAMSPEMLAEYGKKYALDLGYSIDNMAMLAFSGRISELQIGTHLVSVDEVKEIVQAAIEHADKPSADKAIRTMTGKRYDEEHRVILREKDFEFRKK